MDFSTILHNIGELLRYEASAPMLFSSGLFWALFIVFLPVYALLRSRFWQMLLFVVAFSLYFYYKSSGIFFLLLLCTSFLDWSLSHLLVSLTGRLQRKLCVWISIISSLGILGYFKYANFFLWNWNLMVEGNFQPLDIILPVGISFYTFQSISYIVDVYKGRVKPTHTWLEYLFSSPFSCACCRPYCPRRLFHPADKAKQPCVHRRCLCRPLARDSRYSEESSNRRLHSAV